MIFQNERWTLRSFGYPVWSCLQDSLKHYAILHTISLSLSLSLSFSELAICHIQHWTQWLNLKPHIREILVTWGKAHPPPPWSNYFK